MIKIDNTVIIKNTEKNPKWNDVNIPIIDNIKNDKTTNRCKLKLSLAKEA